MLVGGLNSPEICLLVRACLLVAYPMLMPPAASGLAHPVAPEISWPRLRPKRGFAPVPSWDGMKHRSPDHGRLLTYPTKKKKEHIKNTLRKNKNNHSYHSSQTTKIHSATGQHDLANKNAAHHRPTWMFGMGGTAGATPFTYHSGG